MKVVFRVDASVRMGTGHIMRCLTLAQELQQRGVQVRFICGDHLGNLIDWLQGKGIAVTVLSKASGIDVATDAEQTISALSVDRPDWMVVDHYGLDIEWEQRLRPFVGRILVIDDHTGRRHDCDALLDQNYADEDGQRYDGLLPDDCRMLLGPSFALLRKEFSELRQKVRRRECLENVLVFFTGGDDQGETLKAMRGVEIFGQVKRVDVVVGRLSPHNDAIKSKCDELDWGFHCQVDYMPTIISKADLVIGAGGSSNWERCALGVPALVAILADNQATIAQDLDSAGVVINLGWAHSLTPDDYAQALKAFDLRRLSDMSDKALKIIDAVGASRVADALLHL
jgi:UDP-2,4-diacetamido-2,4,6-trideoxy-beta-L-altropyranose hydrolase